MLYSSVLCWHICIWQSSWATNHHNATCGWWLCKQGAVPTLVSPPWAAGSRHLKKIKIWKNSQNQYDVDWLILKLDNLFVKVPQQEQWVLLCKCCQCSTCLHQLTQKRFPKRDIDGAFSKESGTACDLGKILTFFMGVCWYRMDWIGLDVF